MATEHRHYYNEPAHHHAGETSCHHPADGGGMIDFYDTKGVSNWPNVAVICESGKHPVHQPRCRAAVKAVYERQAIAIPSVAYVGEIHPAALERFGLYCVAAGTALNWPALLAALNVNATWQSGKHPVHQSGRCAAVKVVYEWRAIAIPSADYIGEIHPVVPERFELYYVAVGLKLKRTLERKTGAARRS